MNEEKNNNLEENKGAENLGYSFDFANQVETETLNTEPVQETPVAQVVEQPAAAPQMVDVSVPVMDEVAPVNNPETVAVPVTPVVEPVVNETVPTQEPVQETPVVQAVEQPATEPQMVDVSVPVMDEAAPVNNPQTVEVPVTPVVESVVNETVPTQESVQMPVEQTTEVQSAEQETELKDGKSTVRFVIILAVIVIAFIIALPFILNFLG